MTASERLTAEIETELLAEVMKAMDTARFASGGFDRQAMAMAAIKAALPIIRRVHQPPTGAREEAERIVLGLPKDLRETNLVELADAIASALAARDGLMRECKERMAECREALSVDPVDGPTYGLCLSIDDLLARIDAADAKGGGA